MSRKIRCTIVDDHISNAQTLKDLLQKQPLLEVEAIFTDPLEFMKELGRLKSHVYFLDIEMPGISGMELAKELSGKTVVIVSGHKEYAHQGFDLNVLDFVKKPIQEVRLTSAIQKIRNKYNAIADFAYFSTSRGEERLKFADIILIKSCKKPEDPRDKKIFMTTKTDPLIIKDTSLNDLMNNLNPDLFFRISKDCIVNLKHVMARTKAKRIELTPSLNEKNRHEEEVSEPLWKEFCFRSEMV